jgi:hypothetical protein
MPAPPWLVEDVVRNRPSAEAKVTYRHLHPSIHLQADARIVITALLFLIAAQSLTEASENSDAASTLERATAAYSSVLDYHAVVETKVTSTLGDSSETKCRYEIAGSRPRSLFTDEIVVSPRRYEVRLGTDGSSAWGHSPSSKLYVEDSVAAQSAGLLHDLTQQHYRLFTRFQELDAFVSSAVIEGRETLRISGEPHPVPCVRIRLTVPAADWTEQLWIEESRFLVRKSVFRKKELMETITTTTLWRSIDLTSHGVAQFRFTPPANARRTNQLEVP